MSQQSSAQEMDGRSSSHPWFTSEIQHMMYGFGDCSKPLVETAALVEEIVFRQMSQLLYQLEEIAHKRNARFIGIEDCLFLLRRNKRKLHRLLQFLDFKDLRESIKSVEDNDASAEDHKGHRKKRRMICQEFLNSIDQTGELVVLLDETDDDDIKKERKMRSEMLTRNMSIQQYMEYCEARQASFASRYKSQKFKDWVLSGVTLDIKPNAYTLEILSYFAYETVAEIVDLALIVRRDKNISISDPFSLEMAPLCVNYEPNITSSKDSEQQTPAQLLSPAATPTSSSSSSLLRPQTPKQNPLMTPFASPVSSNLTTKAKKKKGISQQSKDLIASQAITPTDICEALRRFHQPIGPFADFSKLPLLAVGQQLLCC